MSTSLVWGTGARRADAHGALFAGSPQPSGRTYAPSHTAPCTTLHHTHTHTHTHHNTHTQHAHGTRHTTHTHTHTHTRSHLEGRPGTAERPLSDLGAVSFRSYWTRQVLDALRDCKGEVSVQVRLVRGLVVEVGLGARAVPGARRAARLQGRGQRAGERLGVVCGRARGW
jgi:hypothetical protein